METKNCQELLGQINLRLVSLIEGHNGEMLKKDIEGIIEEIRGLILRYRNQSCSIDKVEATIEPIVNIIDDWNNKR